MLESKKRAIAKYRKTKCRQFVVTFYPTDSDILEYFEGIPNKTQYFKDKIREDMKEGKRW